MGKSRKSTASEPEMEADQGNETRETDAPPKPTTDKDEYAQLCQQVNEIAKPLADRKLAKKLYKLIRKCVETDRRLYARGVGDMQRRIRKGKKGIVLLAGNVYPIDVYAHIPAVCEAKQIPYCYVPAREHLGLAAGQRRPCIACMIERNDSYGELYDEIADSMKDMPSLIDV